MQSVDSIGVLCNETGCRCEEKVNAFTGEETPLSRIRTKVEQDAGHIVLSGRSVIYLELSLSTCARPLSEERRKIIEKEGGGSYEAEKRRRVGIVCVPTRFLFRVGFKRLSTSCKHFFRVSFRSNDLPRRVLDVSLRSCCCLSNF